MTSRKSRQTSFEFLYLSVFVGALACSSVQGQEGGDGDGDFAPGVGGVPGGDGDLAGVGGTGVGDGDQGSCGAGLTPCGGLCVDLTAAVDHCGTCDLACAPGALCQSSVCACQGALTPCSGACIETQADPNNCGGCGEVCGQGLVCSLGECSDACADGLVPCGSSCVDTDLSLFHCGACDSPCDPGEECVSGACECVGEECMEPDPDPVDCGGVTDACPMSSGITHACKRRFALGVNYAWRNFGGDFGGLAQWGVSGVSQDTAGFNADLAQMKQNGAGVIRWWMWPDFRGDGVQFDGNGEPSGISATAVADIKKALELAEQNDVYLALTLFSFDNFRPTHTSGDVNVRGMSNMVRNSSIRNKLIQNVVRPAAQAVATSPYASRLFAWDVINEPEWAVAPTGAQNNDFTPNSELDDITLSEMKTFINEALSALRQETPEAKLSVGWAAAKWSYAFSDVTNVDFHQPHIYGWVDEWWPYTSSPSALGYSGKPTLMGEFFLLSMPFSDSGNNATFGQILESWYTNGYAGAWAWQHADQEANLPLIKNFSDAKGCPVEY